MMQDHYYIYVMTNRSHSDFHTGVTTHLAHDVYEEKKSVVEHGVHHNAMNCLVYYEIADDIDTALARERAIREQLRHMAYGFITRRNPEWKDLSEEI